MSLKPSMNPGRSFAHLLAALFGNCTDFNRHWKRHSARSQTPDGIEGRWQGEWVSEENGHTGKLRCLLIKEEANRYRARFHATYSKVLRVCYTVPLTAQETNGRCVLKGEVDLGRLAGGVYHYRGEADAMTFNCTYACAYDHGTFALKRPEPPASDR